MHADPFAALAYRILIAAVDLGWEPPGWRPGPDARALAPAPGRGRVESIARAIASQLVI